MGNCFGSSQQSSQAPTPSTTGISGITSQTTSSRISNCSPSEPFSASSGDSSFPNGQILDAPDLRRFTFQDLRTATKNFKPDNLLGEGGFGKVYRGCLEDKLHSHHTGNSKSAGGTLVAVKKLKSESMQGFEEWQAEIDFLGRLSHPNLVKLLGYCWDNEELLLVYEYLQRGSLENHLFGRGSVVRPLPWELRLKIAIGAARAFAFLHASDDRVIFRDIKAANILLDGVYNAKISDFGLAKLGPSASQSHVTTRIMGTYGYAAPEYLATGHLYIKSDVYGFGVVLIELLTGQRALDTTRPTGKHTLVDWIQPFLSNKRKLKSVMDSRLQGRYPEKAAFEIAQLSLKCLAQEPRLRPSMKDVVDTLEKIQAVGENKNPREPSSRNRAAGQPAHNKSCTGSGSNNKQLPLRNNRSSQGQGQGR